LLAITNKTSPESSVMPKETSISIEAMHDAADLIVEMIDLIKLGRCAQRDQYLLIRSYDHIFCLYANGKVEEGRGWNLIS